MGLRPEQSAEFSKDAGQKSISEVPADATPSEATRGFTCHAGIQIMDGRPCPRCGASERDVCGEINAETFPDGLEIVRLHTINDELVTALEGVERKALHWARTFANSEATEARWMEISRWARAAIAKAGGRS